MNLVLGTENGCKQAKSAAKKHRVSKLNVDMCKFVFEMVYKNRREFRLKDLGVQVYNWWSRVWGSVSGL